MDHYEAMVGPSGFFAFGKDSPGIISNWFLASRPGDYVMCYMREMLLLYWREFDRPLQYHFFHQILKESYFLDKDIEKVMSNMPDLGWEPRAVNRKMAKVFEPEQFAQMKQRSPVHKLSHKVKKSASHSKTTIAAVVRGEAS
ncbi:Capsular polysaccharide synthesis protein [compost metagenome]